jgi:hypothetical protein
LLFARGFYCPVIETRMELAQVGRRLLQNDLLRLLGVGAWSDVLGFL